MVNVNEQLGQRIRDIRLKRGVTQEELAHRADLDYSYVNQIENGKRNPSLDAISRIARALEVSIQDLLSF